MKSSDSASFTCNVCGAESPRPDGAWERDAATCGVCGSSVRLRALGVLLSREVFGTVMPVTEFPVLKGVRGFGLSDPDDWAERINQKFDYTNSFYHKPPRFDVTRMDERDFGRYDFIVSSEVMEHIEAPVELAFQALGRMLKPNGILLLTTPYGFGATREHFPELHEYALATPGGHPVLVNRRQDGAVELHDNLVFHGGPGSTLEMRLYTDADLRTLLTNAGFDAVEFVAESFPEFGIGYIGNWSLPIVARKGRFVPPVSEIAEQFRAARRRLAWLEHDLASIKSDYEKFVAFHGSIESEHQAELEKRTAWGRDLERELEERTDWARALEAQSNDLAVEIERLRAEGDRLRGELAAIHGKWWWRLVR